MRVHEQRSITITRDWDFALSTKTNCRFLRHIASCFIFADPTRKKRERARDRPRRNASRVRVITLFRARETLQCRNSFTNVSRICRYRSSAVGWCIRRHEVKYHLCVCIKNIDLKTVYKQSRNWVSNVFLNVNFVVCLLQSQYMYYIVTLCVYRIISYQNANIFNIRH